MTAKTGDKAKVTKDQLRQEIAELRYVGAQMSNICFNLAQGQKLLLPSDREAMDYLRRSWDAIKRSEPSR
jgi:hypothetical protein